MPETWAYYKESGRLGRMGRPGLPTGEPVGDLVGIYRNPDAKQPEAVVVTEDGLIVLRPDASQYIRFADVESTLGPGVGTDSNDISIGLRSGIVVGLRIAGRDGRFRDVFGFVRFLDRVLEDRRHP